MRWPMFLAFLSFHKSTIQHFAKYTNTNQNSVISGCKPNKSISPSGIFLSLGMVIALTWLVWNTRFVERKANKAGIFAQGAWLTLITWLNVFHFTRSVNCFFLFNDSTFCDNRCLAWESTFTKPGKFSCRLLRGKYRISWETWSDVDPQQSGLRSKDNLLIQVHHQYNQDITRK